MKKALALVLVVVLALSMAACAKAPADSGSASYEGSMKDLVTALLDERPVEFTMMDPADVDLTDEIMLQSYLGLTDGTGIQEACFAEPMIGSQACSISAVRVASGTDAKAIAESMKSGIDPRKWVCVEADQLRVGVIGDIVLLVMCSSDLDGSLPDGMMAAFSKILGQDLDMELQN